MNSLIPAASQDHIARVSRYETAVLSLPQVALPVHQALHAGVYARTVCVPEGVAITGALIKIPTLLILSGEAVTADGSRYVGYNVIPAEAPRKMALVALSECYLTMVFATKAKTVEEAEAEFTDEVDKLQSRQEVLT